MFSVTFNLLSETIRLLISINFHDGFPGGIECMNNSFTLLELQRSGLKHSHLYFVQIRFCDRLALLKTLLIYMIILSVNNDYSSSVQDNCSLMCFLTYLSCVLFELTNTYNT